MAASSLSSALSSMEVMLDALMQRGIGKPEEKAKEVEPPALPTRPTVRGRPPSRRVGAPGPIPWNHRPPNDDDLAPERREEEVEEKHSVYLEMERRAVKAEEEARQKDDDVRQKEEFAELRQQVEHYESRLTECELKMKSVEEELLKQITALQMAQSARARSSSVSTTSHHHRELSKCFAVTRSSVATTRADEASLQHHQQGSCELANVGNRQTEVDRLAEEFRRERGSFEQGAMAEADQAKSSAASVDELNLLRQQFGTWRNEYEARLRKAKAELKKLVHAEKSHDQEEHAHRRRCSWWRMKVPRCKSPGCFAIKLHCPSSCCCLCGCFRRWC